MEPTILAGDHFYARSSSAEPHRKEIVVYQRSGDALVKRIVGLPGDTLAMNAGVLLVNGVPLVEPYAQHDGEQNGTDPDFAWQRRYLIPSTIRRTYTPTGRNWGPILVPPGEYFLLGDNRGASYDSRYTGFVARASIIARPRFVYFSKDPNDGVRWRRTGHAISDST